MDNLIDLTGIKKSFGGVQALKGVDLKIKRGEVHCLAGENGSGKSTIIKVISGFYQPDAGEIIVDGTVYDKMTPAQAIEAGIQVIYQDFSIFPNLTARENLALPQVLSNNKKIASRKELDKIAKEALSKIDVEIDLDTRVEDLPVADKQLIAIARALMSEAKMIIMDEPTTALTGAEINRLFDLIRELKQEGVTVLFVSHKLSEVYEICDSITILRNGRFIMSGQVADLSEEDFTYYMTGRKFDQVEKETKKVADEEIVLEVDNLSAPGFADISFKLHHGEILGIAGQLGSGRSELSLSLFGMNKPTNGSIKRDGKTVKIDSVQKAIDLGIALVPEDRLSEGLFLPQSIVQNITVSSFETLTGKAGVLPEKALKDDSQKWVDKIGVATADHRLPVSTLSGGNQQKVVLARWLATKPEILILNGPTVGVDIGAKYDIHALLREAAKQGMAIIVVSDDLAEVESLCDRALVMKQGRITQEINGDDLAYDILAEASI